MTYVIVYAYTQANAEFFDDLGSPGGAQQLGRLERDHPLVEAQPQPVQEG